MEIKEYHTFTWQEILDMKITKSELAKVIGIECSYDNALPIQWLNSFINTNDLDHHQVIFSTFMVYEEGDYFGTPQSGCTKIQQAINKEKIQWIADELSDKYAQSIVDDLKRLTGVDIGKGRGELARVLIETLGNIL